ncbi:MAG: hypothetical protein HY288_09415 [Planctomycetia bacterium]|nr:hypothetical protein [Planctomycetia bacterium]
MADKVRSARKQREIEELARGWGKLLAREMFPEGVGLDVDLFTMEEIAVTAAKSLVRGAVETMTGDQTEMLEPEHPCPSKVHLLASQTPGLRRRSDCFVPGECHSSPAGVNMIDVRSSRPAKSRFLAYNRLSARELRAPLLPRKIRRQSDSTEIWKFLAFRGTKFRMTNRPRAWIGSSLSP